MPHHYKPTDFVFVPWGSAPNGEPYGWQLAHIEGSGVQRKGGVESRFLLVRKYLASSRRWTKTRIRVDSRTVYHCTADNLATIEKAAIDGT